MRNGAIGLVELRQLQYFVKVARKEHVTQAAEELHVAQSAVSRQIHQLEQELGVNLFMQKGRNLHLTAVGQLFCSRVETILKDLDRAVNEVHEFIDLSKGKSGSDFRIVWAFISFPASWRNSASCIPT